MSKKPRSATWCCTAGRIGELGSVRVLGEERFLDIEKPPQARNLTPSRRAVLYAGLVLFLALNVMINVVLKTSGQPTALHATRLYLAAAEPIWADSWNPMDIALNHLQTAHSDLYQQIFFKDKIKFQYAPTSLLFLEPVRAVFPETWIRIANYAAWLVVGLSAIFLFKILEYLTRAERPTRRPAWELAFLLLLAFGYTITFYPLVRAWELGQVQTYINFLSIVGLYAYLRKGSTLSGIAIGLACLLKPQFALFGLWALVRRDWRFLAGLSATAGLGLALSVAHYGLPNHLQYLQVLSYLSQHGEAYYPNQSVNGLLNRAFFTGDSLKFDLHGFPVYNTVVYAGTMITSVLLIGLALFVTARRSNTRPGIGALDFAIALVCFTTASPIAWMHHYGILLPAYAVTLLLAVRLERSLAAPLIVCLAVSYLLAGNFSHVALSLAQTPASLMLSYLFFGALLLLACMLVVRRNEAL